MSRVPFPSIFIGIAGLIPFVAGAAMMISEPDTVPTLSIVPSTPEGGILVLTHFGAVILGFMGGCLWGFSSAGWNSPRLGALALSSLPPLTAFLALLAPDRLTCVALALGYILLQALDIAFDRQGITPDYWPKLRLPLTTIVIICLLIGAIYG